MNKLWEVAGGAITGTEHRRIGRNAQDAYYSISNHPVTIAIVCDGCGSGQHSEVGAKIGARLVAETLRRSIPPTLIKGGFRGDADSSLSDNFWEKVRENVLTGLKNLALAMSGDGYNLDREIIHHYFLFTIVGAMITPTEARVFSVGDGVIIINGQRQILGPFPKNAPPYLAYELLAPGLEKWQFQIQPPMAIENLDSILIGTDGVGDLMAVADRKIPGKDEDVGEISQFWQDDRYFKNPDLIRRKLSLINREFSQVNWQTRQRIKQSGLLPDDTSFIVIRRGQ